MQVLRQEACTCARGQATNTASSSPASFATPPTASLKAFNFNCTRKPSASHDCRFDWTCLQLIHRWRSCGAPFYPSSWQRRWAKDGLTLCLKLLLVSSTLSVFRLALSWYDWERLKWSKCHLCATTISPETLRSLRLKSANWKTISPDCRLLPKNCCNLNKDIHCNFFSPSEYYQPRNCGQHSTFKCLYKTQTFWRAHEIFNACQAKCAAFRALINLRRAPCTRGLLQMGQSRQFTDWKMRSQHPSLCFSLWASSWENPHWSWRHRCHSQCQKIQSRWSSYTTLVCSYWIDPVLSSCASKDPPWFPPRDTRTRMCSHKCCICGRTRTKSGRHCTRVRSCPGGISCCRGRRSQKRRLPNWTEFWSACSA